MVMEQESARLVQETELQYTGERHMTEQIGLGLSWGQIEHMIRYAFVGPFVKDRRVLDMACGSGYGSQYLALQGAAQVIAVEIDHEALTYARKYHACPSVMHIQSDAHSVPQLEDASFDVIVSFETMEHLQRPREFLLELRRLLKPDGKLFLSCPNDYRDSPWISEYHLHKFRFTEFRDLVINIFGEATFLGQHNVAASCLIKPVAPKDTVSRFDAYRSPLPNRDLGHQFIDHISSIESAEGYLAIFGVEPTLILNQLSLSQSAYEDTTRTLHYFIKEAERVKSLVQTTDSQMAALQHQLQVEQSHGRVQQQLQVSLQQSQTELEQAKLQIQQSQTELEQAKLQIQQSQIGLEQAHTKQQQLHTSLQQKQAEISHVQVQLQQSQATIINMKTSKFWKLRAAWFQLKRKLGLTTEQP